MSVEVWKAVFDWAAVVLVGLTFIAGAGALITGKVINDRQSDALRRFSANLTQAQTDLAGAQKLASDAQSGNRELGIKLAEAQAQTIEREEELAAEQRKTAQAQEDAAQAELALKEHIEQLARPRTVPLSSWDNDSDARELRFKALREHGGTLAIIASVPDFEAQKLAWDISNALIWSGWKAEIVDPVSSGIPLGLIDEGVQVITLEKLPRDSASGTVTLTERFSTTSRAAKAVVDLLSLSLDSPANPTFMGVRWEPEFERDFPPPIITKYGFKRPEGAVVILVGMKPSRYIPQQGKTAQNTK